MVVVGLDVSLAEVLERISDAFVALDREWRITYLNRAAARMARRTPEELIGKNLWEEYPDVVGTHLEREYRRAMEEQVKVELEIHYQPLGLWASTTIYPSPSGLTICSQDVTGRKRAEAALAESEARNRMIVETAQEGIWMVDPDYRTIYANDRMATMLGLSPGDLAGRGVPEFVHPDDRPLLARQIEERKQGRRAQYDIRMLRADGEIMWALAQVSPRMSPDGKFEGALGMIADITDRKRAEQEILGQKEWFRVTLSSIGDAVIATDAQGRVTFMNTVAEELTGWPDAEARGRPLRDVFRIVNEQTREPVEDPVSKVLRENRIVGLANHTALISRDGTERPIDDSGAPIRDAGGAILGVILVFRDNTIRAHAERSLREADRRKDEFLAVLAHELRNPLAPIRSSLDVMRLSGDRPDLLSRAREIVERQVEHMTRLVDDLLDVSRINRGKIALRREIVDLGAIVARAVETVTPLLTARRQRLETRLPEAPVLVDGDPTRLAQVVANLLNNASKFTPPEARIVVSAEVRERAVELCVRDEGFGISRESLGVIFEPFRQAAEIPDTARGGLGLGLTLVKSLVELHGGRVSARSEGLGRGSEFVVELPLPVSATRTARPEESVPPTRSPRRIFVVDDNTDAADTLSALLELLGHQSRVAYDPHTALELIPRERPDVVLLDLGMPGMTGHELARRLREHRELADLKIIALSGYGQDDDKRRTREAGFDDHLVKPVDAQTVQALFERIFRSSPTT